MKCLVIKIITFIPKANKPKQFLRNWRPITLLNCTYKMASGCTANRLKTILDKIIEKYQTCFIKGRYIGENIRMIYDIKQYIELHNIPGLLLLEGIRLFGMVFYRLDIRYI